MYDYGEACPISRATSMLGERWTIQIIREMFLGASRFSEFQKYLPKISPSLLNSRLKMLVEQDIIMRKKVPEKRGYEYHLTASGKALAPVLSEIGKWGMRWVYDGLKDEQLDTATLMRDIAVLVDMDQLPGDNVVMQFTLTDVPESGRQFVMIDDDKREVCTENPGYDVDIYFRTTLRTLSEIWWGDSNIIAAQQAEKLQITGLSDYTKNVAKWFPVSSFANCNRQFQLT
jgi:DNA-binding HxlR family transcriptional regulator